jgi:membrane protein DedA with SNARE-associated domain
MVAFPSGCTLVGAALVAVGYLSSHFTKPWNHLYFWLFACVFFVYSIVLLLYLYFTNKVFLKDEKNE